MRTNHLDPADPILENFGEIPVPIDLALESLSGDKGAECRRGNKKVSAESKTMEEKLIFPHSR